MTPPPRTPHQRKQDTLNRLGHDVDAWWPPPTKTAS